MSCAEDLQPEAEGPAALGGRGCAAGSSGESARAAYDRWHGALPVDPEGDAPWHRMLRSHLDVERHVRDRDVLEVACGRGEWAMWLAGLPAPPRRLVAADFAATAVAKARSYSAALRPPSPRWQVADAMSLPYPDDSFDTVFSCETIEHAPDPRRALAEMVRVLRPGGHLFLTTPSYLNLSGAYRLYLRLRGRRFSEGGQPINHPMLLPHTLWMVRRAGLRIRAVDGTGHFLPLWPGRPAVELRFLEGVRWLSRWLATQTFVLGRKPCRGSDPPGRGEGDRR